MSRDGGAGETRGVQAARRALARGLLLALRGSLVFGLLLAAVESARAEGERAVPETWHVMAFVRGSMGIRVIDYWSKGPDMVARTLIGGHPITTIVRDGRYVVFDGLTGKGLDIARSPSALSEDAGRVRPFAFELDELIRDGGEKIEDVRVGAMRGEIWQVRDANGRRKVWTSVDVPRVPLRQETFDRSSGQTIDLDYQGWTFDLAMDEPLFRVPPGFLFERFEYDDYLAKSGQGSVGKVPILYPDLLHGSPPR